MHSYRHGFHAANHADVLKHAIFVQLLDYLTRKDTALRVIDTHAGAGVYDLSADWSRQRDEAAQGFLRLSAEAEAAPEAVPALIQQYLQAVQSCRSESGTLYPGSPWLALQAMRPSDRIHLFETHPTEIDVLTRNLRQRRNLPARQVTLHYSDGFDGLKALLPPPSRRGLAIIDPSYEDKRDYRRTVQALQEGLARFATGCYAIWHPIVQRREADDMVRTLRRLPDVDWLHATLQVCRPSPDGLGLHGSGMFIVNPPWTLRESLAQALPWLVRVLAQDTHAGFGLSSSDDAPKPAAAAAGARKRAGTDSQAEHPATAPGRRPKPAGMPGTNGAPQKKRSPSRR